MIDVGTACGVAIIVGAALSYTVYKVARRDTVPKTDYEHLETMNKNNLERSEKIVTELNIKNKFLEQCNSQKKALEEKYRLLEESHRMLEVEFNVSVGKQDGQSEVIDELREEIEILRRENKSLQPLPIPARKGRVKVVK
jgi:uncharacterized protein related to proFAR isomerase